MSACVGVCMCLHVCTERDTTRGGVLQSDCPAALHCRRWKRHTGLAAERQLERTRNETKRNAKRNETKRETKRETKYETKRNVGFLLVASCLLVVSSKARSP